jgi:hypothetical protein
MTAYRDYKPLTFDAHRFADSSDTPRLSRALPGGRRPQPV